MRREIRLAAALLLAACAHGGGSRPRCDAAPAQTLLGAPATDANRAKAARLAGARESRLVPPDTIVTTAYKFGRLTIDTDAANRMTRIACG